jgi:hypothetical protein
MHVWRVGSKSPNCRMRRIASSFFFFFFLGSLFVRVCGRGALTQAHHGATPYKGMVGYQLRWLVCSSAIYFQVLVLLSPPTD